MKEEETRKRVVKILLDVLRHPFNDGRYNKHNVRTLLDKWAEEIMGLFKNGGA